MARACILTIEPINLGGVPTMVKAIHDFQRSAGHQSRLVYVNTEDVPTEGRRKLLRYYARNWRARREVRHGMDGLGLTAWPVPQWLGHYMPLALAYDELRRSQMHVVVTGSAHLGLPLAVLKKPFIAWVATAYEDEIEGRVAVGDSWAQSLIGGSQWPKLQAQERQVIEAASLVLALSPNTARRLKEIAPNAADKIRTLLCPVDTDSFRPANDGAQAAANPIGSPYLLLTARIRDPRKNAHMLLRAFAGVRAAYPDLKLVFIGDAPFDSHLAVRDELGLGDSVIFLPPKSHSEIIRYYQAAELFTLSSTQEGLAISMLEALACGLPVIATRCGGPEGILQDSPTGRLVPNNDPHAFADAILETLADKPKLASMRATARKFALDNFARPIVQAQLRLAFGEVYPQYFENNHQ